MKYPNCGRWTNRLALAVPIIILTLFLTPFSVTAEEKTPPSQGFYGEAHGFLHGIKSHQSRCDDVLNRLEQGTSYDG